MYSATTSTEIEFENETANEISNNSDTETSMIIDHIQKVTSTYVAKFLTEREAKDDISLDISLTNKIKLCKAKEV